MSRWGRFVDAAIRWGVAALVALAIVGLARRVSHLERRTSRLENKGCLMTGAHTGCERARLTKGGGE